MGLFQKVLFVAEHFGHYRQAVKPLLSCSLETKAVFTRDTRNTGVAHYANSAEKACNALNSS